MTRRRILEHHRRALAEIRDILNSMKTLAYMETRKLTGFINTQHDVVQSIEDVAADLLSFYPGLMTKRQETLPVYILIGSERGFCGDFNHVLFDYLESTIRESRASERVVIAIGRKLHTLLEGQVEVTAAIDGATIVEEVTSVLVHVADEFSRLQADGPMLSVFVLYHGGDNGIVMQKLLPPFQSCLDREPRFPHPPVLNEELRGFLAGLTDHYLFAALHEMLFTSLMAENQQRLAHLEGAVKHLDEESAELVRRCNTLRQAEIIEEIEVNLLGASGPGEFMARGATPGVEPG